MKKIYYNNRTLIVKGCEQPSSSDVLVDDYKDIPNLLKSFMEDDSLSSLSLKSADEKALMKAISKDLKVIEAAGGAVLNDAGDLLMIFRLGCWDLPKGKVEKGEEIKAAAVREVEEECGVSNLQLGKKLCKTYHIYIYKDEPVLKVTHWFNMHCAGSFALVPQTEEDITEAVWVPQQRLAECLQNTYGNIKDVIAALQSQK